MIGLGKWQFVVDTMFFKGTAIIQISNKNGQYDFQATIPGMQKTPSYQIKSIEEEGNTLIITATTDIFKGKDVNVVATFENNVCNGYIKVPMLGKIKIKDGVKIG